MPNNTFTFGKLRRLLLDLDFAEKTVPGPNIAFYHVPSKEVVFVFRPYKPNERVTEYDVVDVRKQLDWRGLLDAEAFDNLLRKASA
jgi:hypothetical protein